MNKKYLYNIEISFDKKREECEQGIINSKYLGGRDNEDIFNFKSCSFTLKAERSRIYKDGTILCNNSNSINTQLLKGLLFYYSIAKEFPNIKNLIIKRILPNNKEIIYKKETQNIKQPITGKNPKGYSIPANKLMVIFEESEKGNAIRIALSYWLKALSSEERYYKFDHLWRSFNRLYIYQGNCKKEFDCMIQMRKFIIDNSNKFMNTVSITNTLSYPILREFRWRKMILNDYDTQNKTSSFVDFVERYHDKRIMKLMNEMLPYREDFLKREKLLLKIKSHINSNNKSTHDIELITILCIKYAYFVRNKMFHGEIPDSTFKIQTDKEDEEIDRLNKILTSLIYEVIYNNIYLR